MDDSWHRVLAIVPAITNTNRVLIGMLGISTPIFGAIFLTPQLIIFLMHAQASKVHFGFCYYI